MILRFTYHILIDDFCAHYRRAGFDADRVGPGLVRVGRAGSVDPDEAEREAVSRLHAWDALHPEAPAEILELAPAAGRPPGSSDARRPDSPRASR